MIRRSGRSNTRCFPVDDRQNCGALAQGDDYAPGTGGPVVYLDGGKDLDTILSKVKSAGGSVALKKTFLGDHAGHIGTSMDSGDLHRPAQSEVSPKGARSDHAAFRAGPRRRGQVHRWTWRRGVAARGARSARSVWDQPPIRLIAAGASGFFTLIRTWPAPGSIGSIPPLGDSLQACTHKSEQGTSRRSLLSPEQQRRSGHVA